jgi:hypothetical protein
MHATWATVGMLMCENKAELLGHMPLQSFLPKYTQKNISAYEYLSTANLEGENKKYHFGKHLVEQILKTPHQELASHTFSHFYTIDCTENTAVAFGVDCDAFTSISAWTNTSITSIVFPRNQITHEALRVCQEKGMTAYRGTPNHFLYTGKAEEKQTNLFLRGLRLIDTYLNLTGHHTHPLTHTKEHAANPQTLINVCGSWFLRPYSHRLRFLEWLKIRRIKNAMTYAAKNGELYHLWWHPHNFGINQEQNFKNLESILRHFTYLQKTYGMESLHMREFAGSTRD